jgi:cell surface protein SprA
MMGIRNNQGQVNTGAKSVEVWANELKLSDVDQEGGWAANGRVSARLADLGTVTVAMGKSTSGFGSIDQSTNEQQIDGLSSIDVSSTIDWGRFFPEKAGVRIPMYYGYSKSKTDAKYNPLEPDILLSESLKALDTKQEKDSLKNLVEESVVRKSINFTNVKIEPQKQKDKTPIWDPQNFAVTYSYNEVSEKDVTTESDVDKTHQFMLTYNYSNQPKLIQPLKKIKLFQKGPLKLIGDFNFYPLPSQISFRSNIYRQYHKTQTRSITNPDLDIAATYEKEFTLSSYFDLRYDLTRSLKFDFSSSNSSTVDEPEGSYEKEDDDYQLKKDSILTNLWHLGRPTLYNHSFNLTYQVPLRSFKALNFMTSSIRYSGTYQWVAGSQTDDETINQGNTITNTNNITVNGNANMQTLFNKVPYFKEVNQKAQKSSTSRRSSSTRSSGGGTNSKTNQTPLKVEDETYTKRVKLVANTPQKIAHKLNTKKVKILVTDIDGKVVPGKLTIIDANNIEYTPLADSKQAMLSVSGKRGDQPFIKDALDFTTRLIVGFKTISLTYTNNGSTTLPGYLPEPSLFGTGRFSGDSEWGSSSNFSGLAPGLPFLFGWQDDNFAVKAADNGWITTDTTMNSPFVFSENERINLRATWEPIPDLQFTISANRTSAKSTTEYYDYEGSSFMANSHSESGSFSMSALTLGTAFFSIGKKDVTSSNAFENMKDYREVIARRLASQRGDAGGYDPTAEHSVSSGYPDGYGPTSVEVLVPAFLAAYQNKDPESVSLGMFPSLKYMRPNWTVSYKGMVSKIPGLNKIMRSLNFQHTYTSSYTVGSYSTNLNYDENSDGISIIRNLADNFVPAYDFSSVNIVEAFNPLINMDIMWKSDFTSRGQIKRSRNLTLSLANNQLTEVLSNEYVVGLGYRFTHMDLIIKTKNSQKAYSNDLNLTADISYRKSKTLLRQLDEDDDDEITAGNGNFTIKTYANYSLSDKFEMSVYFDHVLNDPYTSSSYRTTTSSFGVSFRFALTN